MTDLCRSFAEQIQKALGDFHPKTALILGSGLGALADQIQNPIIIKYTSIKGFPKSTVSGHAGQFVAGILKGKRVLCMQGRIHLYEGHAPQDIAQIIKSFKLLGIKTLVVTNAAGSLNKKIKAGSIMLITDHINFSFSNPLIGSNDETFGPRFPDMSTAYTPKLQEIAQKAAKDLKIELAAGTYLMVSGPNFETAAEVKAFGILGADAVGMSTVPEVLTAVYCGMEVLGFSVITNLGTGLQKTPQSHAETLHAAESAAAKLSTLLATVFERM